MVTNKITTAKRSISVISMKITEEIRMKVVRISEESKNIK